MTGRAEGEPRNQGRLDRIAAWAARRPAVAIVAAWSFAEAIVFPIVPDVLLDVIGLAAPRRAGRLFLISVLASVAGTALLFALASYLPALAQGVVLAVPGVDRSMLDSAGVAVGGGDPFSLALFGPGTPLKVFTVAWALGPGTAGPLLLGAVLNRCTRILPTLVGAAAAGAIAPRWLRRHERPALGLYTIAWISVYSLYFGAT